MSEARQLLGQRMWQIAKEKCADLKVVAFDPGETTGACTFVGGELVDFRQIDTKDVAEGACRLKHYIQSAEPQILVYETYHVYEWKKDEHVWANLHTPRLIGALQYLCYDRGEDLGPLPVIGQSAQLAKGFATDENLEAWGFWKPGMKHARDAIRHAAYYILVTECKVTDPGVLNAKRS